MRAERGTAVIMAMLVVAAAATLVSGALWQQSALIRETENELEYAQARWLIRGAIDWAGVILREDARTSSVDHGGEPWAVPLADTRLNENDGRPAAYLAGAIEDEQAKFNLRNLVAEQEIDERQLAVLRRLFVSLSISETLGARVAERMRDAVRANAAQRPALGLVAVDELLAVPGMEPAAIERLRPYLTLLPEATPVNANTVSAEVLAAQFADFGVLDARRVITARESAYFKDLGDARTRLTDAGVANAGAMPLAVATRYFAIEGNVAYGNARLRARALVRRDGPRLEVLWLKELGMKTLRVRLCPLAELGAETALEYEVLDDRRQVVKSERAVLAALPRVPRTELVIAAPDVLLIEAALPPLSGARLRAALQAIAEPHILTDATTAYVVAGPRLGSRTTLAVLDRVLLQRALEVLRRVKIVPASALPEQLSLPLVDGHWRARVHPSYGCLRTAEMRGLACSAASDSEPPVELRLALEQAGEARPQAIEVEGPCDTEAWGKALGIPVLAAPAAPGRVERPVLELLQYEFAANVVDWRAWRVPVALAALCAVTWIIGLNVDAWRMLGEERALRGRMEATFRDAFPRVPVVLDPLAQMRRGVSDLRTGADAADPRDFLPLAASLARAIPGEADFVRALDFRDQVLRVDLEPRVIDTPTKRETLVRQLTAAGLTASFAENTLTVRGKGGGS